MAGKNTRFIELNRDPPDTSLLRRVFAPGVVAATIGTAAISATFLGAKHPDHPLTIIFSVAAAAAGLTITRNVDRAAHRIFFNDLSFGHIIDTQPGQSPFMRQSPEHIRNKFQTRTNWYAGVRTLFACSYGVMVPYSPEIIMVLPIVAPLCVTAFADIRASNNVAKGEWKMRPRAATLDL